MSTFPEIPETWDQFAQKWQDDLKQLKKGNIHLEMPEMTEEERKELMKTLAVAAAIGIAAYLAKRAADGVGKSGLGGALHDLGQMPGQIAERLRSGFNGDQVPAARRVIIESNPTPIH